MRAAVYAQDGHSLGEQALYEALWQNGTPHTADTKIITIGYRQMAHLARMTLNNCKANIQSLVDKLSVEEVDGFSYTHGRTYLIHAYGSILQRRRQAGLTHFVKSRGVRFIDPDTGEPLTQRRRERGAAPERGIPHSGVSIEKGVPERGKGGIPPTGKKGIPPSDTHPIRILTRNSLRNDDDADDDAIEELEQKLLKTPFADFDRRAISAIWRQGREAVPDITPDEVLQIFLDKARSLAGNRTVENKNGLLLWSWPSLLTPARVAQLREERRLAEESVESAQYTDRFHQMLSDPEASEEEKRVAMHALGLKT